MNNIVVAIAVFIAGFAAAWYAQEDRYAARMAERERDFAQAAQNAEAAARQREQELQKHADQISQDAARRQQVLADRAAASDRAARGLRDEIARLNARPAPADSAAAGYADEARVARELLGACAGEYRDVAQSADQLRDQVIGLQDYARSVAGR